MMSKTRSVVWVFSTAQLLISVGMGFAEDHPLREEIADLQQEPKAAAYAGWLDYLLTEAQRNATDESETKLTEWVRRIQAGDDPLPSQRGYFEWAYLSRVDGRGQPLMIAVPLDYDAARSWPLVVYLHGYGGDHRGHGPKVLPYNKPFIQVWVYGRARGGGYLGLGEVDVLEAIDFVSRHWNIDPDRHHLLGGSMGGSGVLRIATRHPHRFASARPLAVSGLEFPMENLVNLPVLTIHGGFDEIIPQIMMLSAFERWRAQGGPTAWYIDDAHGHGARNSKPTMADFEEVCLAHRRALDVFQIRYTALDEVAHGAYWAFVEEWGPEGKPAHLNLRMTRANTLFASLENVDTARLDMTLAPVDRTQALTVLCEGQLPLVQAPPLPDTLYLTRSSRGPSGMGWSLQAEIPEKPDYRLHAPGGAQLLYSGEPLMIVYGTAAWGERNEALRRVAELASLSTIGAWPPDEPKRGGWPAYHMPYGRHPVKADHEVTEEDIQNHNLLLLGDPRHNALIQRIQKQLPIQLNGTHVRSNDGHAWSFDGAIFGLLHYNPLAPHRLIYWVAADETEDYGPGTMSPATTLMDIQAKETAPPDFLMLGNGQRDLLSARRFDSRWRWEAGYGESPWFHQSIDILGSNGLFLAHVLRRAAGTDFALTRGQDWSAMQLRARGGVTRLADVRAMFYHKLFARMTLNGRELSDLHRHMKDVASSPEPLAFGHWKDLGRFVPDPGDAPIRPVARYTIAMPNREIFSLARYTRVDPGSFELVDITLRDAWIRYARDVLRTAGETP